MTRNGLKLSDIGEVEAIKLLLNLYKDVLPKEPCLPIDDDVQAINDCKYAIKIDGYSDRYSKYPWESWSSWGWKAITATVSDICAKGYMPIGVVYSLGLPKNMEVRHLLDLANGIKSAIKRYGMFLLGGDLNASPADSWIDVSIVGKLVTDRPIPRSGAKEGDFVYTTVKNGYGYSSLVYKLYKENKVELLNSKIINKKVEAVVEFPQIAKSVQINASVDSSDSLAKSLWFISKSSNVVIEIDRLPLSEEDKSILNEYYEAIEEAVFFGGEEYEIIFTSPQDEDIVRDSCKKVGIECIKIGKVRSSKVGGNVFYENKLIPFSGWDQFKN